MRKETAALVFVCAWFACACLSIAQTTDSSAEGESSRGRVFLVDGASEPIPAGDGEETARSHLSRNSKRYGLPAGPAELKRVEVRESLIGKHFHFSQYVGGIPVHSAGVTVSVSHTNKAVYRVHSAAWPTEGMVRSGKVGIDSEAALDRAWNHVRVKGKLNAMPGAEIVWVPSGKELRLAYRTEIACSDPLGTWEHMVDAETGEILSSRNRMRTDSRKRGEEMPSSVTGGEGTGAAVSRREAMAAFTAAQHKAPVLASPPAGAQVLFDSVAQGTAWVFDPDPKTALMSDSLLDSSSAATFVPAMVSRPLRDITFDGSVYRLTGPWVTIADFDSPSTAPSTTANGVWSFPRGNNGLNDAIVYFHLDQSQRYLQALGYTGVRGIQSRSIPADSDGAGGADNSYFDPGANRVTFGHGGVDDSEDADVILHEYGHAIEHGINPGFDGGDTGAIGEGFGDYWAGSYSLSCSNGADFHPDWIFTWDGHNQFWDGRILNSAGLYVPGRTYDAHAYVNGVLGDELWSAPLFQSLKRLLALGRPREESDAVVIESHFGMGYGTRMPDMAQSVVDTALELYPAGPHAGIYFSEFTNRNILTTWNLVAPAVVFPPEGEFLVTGVVQYIRWTSQPTPVAASAVVQSRGQGVMAPYWQYNVDSGTAGWTVSHKGGLKNWKRVTTASHSPTMSWWADEVTAKTRMYLVSPTMVLSNGVTFSFWHKFNVEAGHDGCVVELSVNGSTWVDVTTNVTSEGYNTLTTILLTSDNVIKGRKAFSGSSGGFVQSFIDLSKYGGSSVKIRFFMSTDTGGRAPSPRGWWVDDMALTQASWENIGTTSLASGLLAWTPPRVMTGAVVRVKATAPGCADSDWALSGTFTVSGDGDGDGLPDGWELAYFGSLAVSDGTGDFDGDGSSDYDEWIAGTSPTQAKSILSVTDITVPEPGVVSVGWASSKGRVYELERVNDLVTQSFSVAASNLVAKPETNYWQGADQTPSSSFWRVRVQQH